MSKSTKKRTPKRVWSPSTRSQENEGTYLAGVDTYTAGLVSYSEGKSTLSAGYAAYYAGKKQLEEGKAAYAAGKKQIEDNTAAYNEGKATLAKIEPLMPYVDQYVKFRNGTISNLAGFSSAQAWFVSVVRPIAASKGLVIPDDVTDLPAYVQQMVADGKIEDAKTVIAILKAAKYLK